jgi:hypothetical protein
MAIDLQTETIIDALREGPAYLGAGRNGKPPHKSFMIRAITKGSNGHKLEALRVGSRWITSIEALQRWAEAQTAAKIPGTSKPTTVTRRGAAERATRELDRLGF